MNFICINKCRKIIIFMVFFLFLGVLGCAGNNFRKFPESFGEIQSNDTDKPTLIYAMPDYNFLGDTEVMKRLVLTAKKMGWRTISYDYLSKKNIKNMRNTFGIYIPSGYLSGKKIVLTGIPLFAIDWIVPRKITEDPKEWDNFLEAQSSNLGVQAVLGTSYNTIDRYIEKGKKTGNLKFIMTWYPTVGVTKYKPNPIGIMYCGHKCVGNIRTESKKYQNLWEELDKTAYFSVYGSKNSWTDLVSYKGNICADGESFVRTINQHGIYLVFHGEKHLKEGAPSGRIFEGAAAAAVIISDKHPFVKKEFGDSVLYVDETRDDMFEQIEAHMRWIQKNPEAAKAKADLAHAIFLNKFSLEAQLSRLYKYFKETKKDLNIEPTCEDE